MADKQNFTALDWVAGEIAETLKEAGQLLEVYVANPEDATRIRFCLNHIHQVYNILQMVELHGGALLAEEMEQLAEALIEHRVGNATDAHEVLMRAILQLPAYLDRVKAARTDDPASLMGLLNDLRAVRGESLFTETQLFGPNMRAAHQISGPRVRFDEASYSQLLQKLKQTYEKAMFQVLRDRQLDDQLPILQKIFDNFKKICQGTARAPMWDVCLAVVEGIANDSIAAGVAMNNLLRQLDDEIGQMLAGGVAALDQAPPDELIKNLLYYIALAPATTPKVSEIKALYQLDLALPGNSGGNQMLAPDNTAMSSVVVAILDEFQGVKALLDQLASGEPADDTESTQAINTIRQAADTLAVLGLAEQRRQLVEIADQLRGQIDSGRTAFDSLMDIAAHLVQIEAELHSRYNRAQAGDDQSRSSDYTMLSAQESVLTECHNGLEQAKEAIVEYIGSQWNKASLAAIPAVLQAVRGGLTIIQQGRAARVIGSCQRFIDEQLIKKPEPPSFEVLDVLADAIASVEYYLECLDEDVIEEQDKVLQVAEDSVARLGYPIAQKTAADYLEPEPLAIDLGADVAEPVAEVDAAQLEVVPVPDAVAEFATEKDELVAAAVLPEIESVPAADTVSVSVAAEQTPLVTAESEPVPVIAAPSEPQSAGALPEYCDAPLIIDDWDDEIAEIFIEEVEEVLEAINENYPKWKANFGDSFALTEFRRGFHTLKGSGRMAKALELGELAWSVENMLNRVLDGSMEASDDVCTIIEQVTAKVPSMLAAFAAKKLDPQPALSARLSAAAFALAEGRPMPSLEAVDSEPVSSSAEVPETVESVYQRLRIPAVDCEKMDDSLDATLWEIFASEAEAHLDVVDEWLAQAQAQAPLLVETTDPLQRALHTLKGSAHMAEVTPIAELASPLERLVKSLRGYQVKVGEPFCALLRDCVDEIRYGLSLIDQHRRVQLPNSDDLLLRIQQQEQAVSPNETGDATSAAVIDLSAFNHFLLEVLDVLMDPQPALQAWVDGDDLAVQPVLQELEAMRVASVDAGLLAVGKLIVPLQQAYQRTSALAARQALLPTAMTAQQQLIDYLDQLAASEDLAEAEVLIDALNAFDAEAWDEPQADEPQAEPIETEADVAVGVAQTEPVASSNAGDCAMLAELDGELLEIFLEEADELLEQLGSEIHTWEQAPEMSQADSVRRTLHTFKGGARMAGLMQFGEWAHELESFLEFHVAGADSKLFARLNQCQDALYRGVDMVRSWLAGNSAAVNFANLMSVAEPVALVADETPSALAVEALPEVLPVVTPDTRVDEIDASLDTAQGEQGIEITVESSVADESARSADTLADDLPVSVDEYSFNLDALLGEAPVPQDRENVDLVDASDEVSVLVEAPQVIEPVQAFSVEPAAEFASLSIEDADADVAQPASVPDEFAALLDDEIGIDTPSTLEESIETDVPEQLAVSAAVGDELQILAYADDLDQELLEIFLDEADELTEELEQLIASWQAEPEAAHYADSLRRNLHTLKGGARMCGLLGLGELGHNLETELEFFSGHAGSELFGKLLRYQDAILAGVAQGRALARGEQPQPFAMNISGAASAAVEVVADHAELPEQVAEAAIIEVAALANEMVDTDPVELVRPDAELVEAETAVIEPLADEQPDVLPETDALPVAADDEQVVVEQVAVESPVDVLAEPVAEVASVLDFSALGLAADVDNDMLEIFIDEAVELLEDLEAQIADWRSAPEDSGFADAIKRNLHTYKGGARMAGVMGLGQLAHDVESSIEFHQGTATAELFDTLDNCYEQLSAGTELLRQVLAGEGASAPVAVETVAEAVSVDETPVMVEAAEGVAADGVTDSDSVADIVAEQVTSAIIIPFRSKTMPHGLAEAIAGEKTLHASLDSKGAQSQQEQIKVSAELLENLVNLAGETSINRARVEQQMIDMERSAEEMDAVIKRLQDQLRRLESETDAQIQSRMSEMQERADGFDPLEMDRYSTLQQLTSSLSESSSDLIDVRNSLANKLRDTETLLVQQARINTGLQEGLMRSRMVPFSRLEPRLRRIVRQVAQELGKDIQLELQNVQGELDRTMLERMIAPLEHMLRNACDHGIESPEKRAAAGKPKQGRIILSMGRDGGDILLTLKDDGGGVNVDAVRNKAIERGLLKADVHLPDADVVQFILQAGFSTAEKITQISGRGVGMDVVSSEIKAMGGSVTIHSEFGQGTEFVVRLPFTVSVNRALMVRVGEETYAIPLSSIEGIVRVSPYELEAYYEDPDQRFNYAGRDYEVRYLGAMLHTKLRPNIEQSLLPEPMLLVRSAEHTVALHVDQLIGSREVVVKALGTQFAQVPGLSGATLLGDGSVVVILDLIALVRARQVLEAQRQMQAPVQAPTVDETITVMVCDDSVTVRKVTSRLLEREGFSVMTAKDGADALLQMQERIPDVLLLDIEMPRMDGFEVASTMKNSQVLQDVPIIMITSRTGAKHKERAEQMGVERYMGKPYVEEELLNTINDLVGERLVRRMARYEQSQR